MRNSIVQKDEVFLSTCPVRGTTVRPGPLVQPELFLSTCPVRGTTTTEAQAEAYIKFLSTCPVRGTTGKYKKWAEKKRISIHVPREGHDTTPSMPTTPSRNFYPRAP